MKEVDRPNSLRETESSQERINLLSITEDDSPTAKLLKQVNTKSAAHSSLENDKDKPEAEQNEQLTDKRIAWEKAKLDAQVGNDFGANVGALFNHPSDLTKDLAKGMMNEISEHPGRLGLTAAAAFGGTTLARELPNLGIVGKVVFGVSVVAGAGLLGIKGIIGVSDIGKEYRMIDALKQNSGPKVLEDMLHQEVQQYGNSLAKTGAALLGASPTFAFKDASIYGLSEAPASLRVQIPSALYSAFTSPNDTERFLNAYPR